MTKEQQLEESKIFVQSLGMNMVPYTVVRSVCIETEKQERLKETFDKLDILFEDLVQTIGKISKTDEKK